MELLPLIRLKRKILVESSYSLEDIIEKSDRYEKIYILDLDGIERDKPNLCTYQRLSASHDLWVDNGPRNLGDVVDAFMAGATDITIRASLGPNLNISDIREISENKVFANIDFESERTNRSGDLFFYDSDGLVNFNSKEKLEAGFRYHDYLKQLRKTLYSYEVDSRNVSFWGMFGAKGLLVDIDKIEEFKKWIRK